MPTPKYGVYDGFATRFTSDGEIWVLFGDKWCEPSRPMQVYCYECAVLSEAEYHRIFGPSLPPLPDAAFCSGWFSPLI
jgi:hypothetical protein